MAFPSKGKDRPVGPKGAKPTKRPTKKNPVVKGTLPPGPPGLAGGGPPGLPPAPLGPPAPGVGPAGGVGPQAALLAKLMSGGGGGGGGYGA